MYLDYLKADYSDKNENERRKYQERDKEHLGNIIIDKVTNTINQIVDRWWSLDNIGYINEEEKYLELLKEAEELYCFGHFTGCIALIGIGTEEFSKHLAVIANLEHKELNQHERLKLLKKEKIITKEIYTEFNTIKLMRNLCVHYDEKFKNLSETDLEGKALSILNHYKMGISNLMKSKINDSKEILERVINQQKLNFEEFKLKNRNLQKEIDGFDLQISPDRKLLVFESLYYVDEIDIENKLFKEMTLVDLEKGAIPFVVDLTLPDANMIERIKLKEKNVIRATVISIVTSAGITEEWKLLNIKDVFRDEYKLW